MANRRFGELRPDIWTRPGNLGPPPVEPNWIVTTGTLNGIEPERLVQRLWDLDALADEAHRLLAEMAARRERSDWDDHASIPDLFTTSAAAVRYLRSEPLLPSELTPPDWPVDEVRTTYDRFEADHQRLLQRFLRTA
jgi:phenylacetic acid degradation operon negative regulatory protein